MPLDLRVQGLGPLILQLGALRQGLAPAAQRAINRALTSGRTLLARGIARGTGVPQGRLRGRLRVRPATRASLTGVLAVGPEKRPLRLIRFTRWLQVKRGKYGRVPVLQGEGSRFADVPARAFVARHRNNPALAVYARDAKTRLPVTELAGPFLADYVRETGLEAQARAQVRVRFQVEIEREIRFRVQRASGVGRAA